MDDRQKQIIRKFFKKDKFAEYCGIELVDIAPGPAKTCLKLEDCHLNGLSMGHGAAVFTLANLVFAVAANLHGTIAVVSSGQTGSGLRCEPNALTLKLD